MKPQRQNETGEKPRRWKRVDDYCKTNGFQNVSKVVVAGRARFEAWQRDPPQLLATFDDPQAATDYCDGLTATGKPRRNFDQLREALKQGASS